MARKKKNHQPVGSPRNRVQDVLGNGNGSTDTIKMPTPEGTALEPVEEERIPATEATYLAAQLHEVRSQLVNMKQLVLKKDQALLQKDQALLQKDQLILNLEAKMIDEENAKLRVAHKLEFDKTIHKDDATGDVYWVKNTKQDQ